MRSLFFFFFWIIGCLQAYELGIGSMFRNEAPYLKEWIEYHRMVGVDHFWLYDNSSSDNWRPVLQPYIDEGLVEVFDWPRPEESSYASYQVDSFRDAIRRAVGVARWIALIDIDEFILPLTEKTVPDCLNAHFSDVSAVYVSWRCYGTGGVTVPEGDPILCKLTACSEITHPNNVIGKSIVKPETIDLKLIWYNHNFPLLTGVYVDGDHKQMRFNGTDLPTDGHHHSRYMRINHYSLRDENFYWNNRLAKALNGFGNKFLIQEHYVSFSKVQDYAMVDFIKKNYPIQYKSIWKK